MIADKVSDIEFQEREVIHRDQFLYVYGRKSGLLRSAVRAQVETFAKRAGWEPVSVMAGGTLREQMRAPSLLGEMFVVCDAAEFSLADLQGSLIDIVDGGASNHMLLMVADGSELLEEEEWIRAKDAFGLIEEPLVTIDNYRSITRFLLRRSDLATVQHLGDDPRFLGRVKAFVQDSRSSSPRSLAMEIDRIILTEMKNGAFEQETRLIERRERRVLSEGLNQFLDDRRTGTLYPLLQFLSNACLSGDSAAGILERLYRASANVVAGRDQRYKRNREGNPAVLPYLAWGILLLEYESSLMEGNFMVAFEHLCQAYHGAAGRVEEWFVDETNWQAVLLRILGEPAQEITGLGQARATLCSALNARSRALLDRLQLREATSARFHELVGKSAVPANE
ncbi:hypothetical protein [Bradyrhizobium sp. 62]|uniref:hypothetical protein n=1 Tax=Bradyrhizobium sp. 62 TaxID=1043588 RepID=UPI001FF7CF2A|nr:hypothetical protein [Bradyrhizobium sp. 62]MCK1366382.1 hypothetical protein [Bradyrhizobium sp. 62]